MSRGDGLSPATLCVHGTAARAAKDPLVAPLQRSTTFVLDDEAYRLRREGRVDLSRAYARETSPTIEAAEGTLAALEGAERALFFASGQAATHALLLAVLERGDRLLHARQIYGGSPALFRMLLPRLGVEVAEFDLADHDGLRELADERTRLVFCETVSNPLTAVADLPAIAEILRAGAPRALLAVDATLSSPMASRPLRQGADVVMHSATKYLGGHTDLTGGVLAGSDELMRAAWTWRTRAGGCADPEAAYLLVRGLRTLALRVPAQSANALHLARFLDSHPRVERVHYCGLPSDPWHGVASKLLAVYGGLLSFVLREGDEAALELIRGLRLFQEASSLGGVESLATRPLDLSHAHLSAAERERAGIAPGLVRLAIGVEDAGDLVADLDRALGAER